jgi:hypothetical protein
MTRHRRQRSRSAAAAEHIREAVRAVMLGPNDLPRADAEQAAAIQALRRRLARTILGATVGWNLAAWEAARAAERGEGAVWGGSGPPAPHWACKRNRGHSGATATAPQGTRRPTTSPNIYRVCKANRAGNERA